MPDARTEAVEAMAAVMPVVEESLDDDTTKAEYLLDILAPYMVRLVIERGGLVQVGWMRPFGAQRVGPLFGLARKPAEHEDDQADSTLKPVYRLSEEPT